jgi:hypothetical protein
MICPNCGYENENGARFCKRCGVPQGMPQSPPPQPAYTQPAQSTFAQPSYGPPDNAYAQPPYTPAPGAGTGTAPKKKSRAGLIIGICAGVLVIAGVVLALLFLFPFGPSAQGHWVAESEGMVLILDRDGGLTMYSLSGAVKADYDFDRAEGTGSFKADGVKYEFTVEEDRLKLTDKGTGETTKFSRAEEEPDIEKIVTAPLIGLWTNEETASVIEFKAGGKCYSYTTAGDFSGKFEFDIRKGEGVFDLSGTEYAFTGDGNTVTLEGDYVYKKASSSLDIAAFISAHSNPLPGIWYDVSGTYGTLEFFEDGAYVLTSYGIPFYGTYTFNAASGTGEILSEKSDMPGTIVFADGMLGVDGIYFTRDYVEQPGAEDLYSTIIGTWYESNGLGYITFYDDGSLDMFYYDTYYWGSVDYDPFSWSGDIALSTGESLYFYLLEGTMQMEGMVFTRDYAEIAGTVEGTWYDTQGEYGTLTFYTGGTVDAYLMGMSVSGTYEYDYDTGTGSMRFVYYGQELLFDFFLDSGMMVVRDFEGTVTVNYTQSYVAQNS